MAFASFGISSSSASDSAGLANSWSATKSSWLDIKCSRSSASLGFGTFSTADRAARTAKVPGTDRTVNVPATTVAKFKVGKSLKEAVSGKK